MVPTANGSKIALSIKIPYTRAPLLPLVSLNQIAATSLTDIYINLLAEKMKLKLIRIRIGINLDGIPCTSDSDFSKSVTSF